jgi:hypothetical protein
MREQLRALERRMADEGLRVLAVRGNQVRRSRMPNNR